MNDEQRARWEDALAGKTGKAYWRSVAELLDTPEFRAAIAGEFPEGARDKTGIGRRTLLQLLGASMALAGVGCSRDKQAKILPYTVPPADITAGLPQYYATSMPLDGFAVGLLVKSQDGRPIKIEGNPAHPASLGATGVYEQASVLGLYDPHRARGLRRKGGPATWDAFIRAFTQPRADGGAGLRFLLLPTSSPLMGGLIGQIQARFPAARFTFYSPVQSSAPIEGARLAFGRRLQPQFDFSKAAVILSLDADFAGEMPFSVPYSMQFAERRRVSAPGDAMNRLYVIESMLSPSGSLADHRLRRRPGEVARAAATVAAELVLGLGVVPKDMSGRLAAALTPFRAREDAAFFRALARDLQRNAGAGLVIAGARQPPVVHAIAHLLNGLLGNAASAWTTAPTLLDAGPAEQDLPTLAGEIGAGKVDTLVILEGNPAYDAPADLGFSRLLAAVPTSVYLGLHDNETARATTWFVPAAHYLEAWGDARAYDGTISLIQPLIKPLYGGRTPSEILSVFTGEPYPDAHKLLRAAWSSRYKGPEFQRFWQETLRAGLLPGSSEPRVEAALLPDSIAAAIEQLAAAPSPPPDSIEVAFLPDPSVYDGRFTNNAWLLELPRPITKLTWDNAALLSPKTALRLGVASEDMVELELYGRKLRMPALIVPGHADEVVSLHLGYGREGAEALASGVGFNVYPLRTAASPSFAGGLIVRKVADATYPLALTQHHWDMQGRPIALSATREQFQQNPGFASPEKGPVLSLYTTRPSSGDQWAMTIDMSICTGCSACVVACQAENNIPVVGKEDVQKSREMHWLRIDTYFSGSPEAPEAIHQPMLCQHCEKAPCEYVCPVNATVHSPDGLNEMVYNRCVGTRFCSNNCPYKVRRFNWFDYGEKNPANQGQAKLQKNPDVTVRERGVMEKCSYCVQRIRSAEINAQIERRPIREGEVVTACAQACPTQAIQFGSLAHRSSKMVQWRNEPRSYDVLHELGTSPRTKYLAQIKNPNPELA